MTPRVRHQTKYIDIPVPESRGFVFSRNFKPAGIRAQTLREFTAAVEKTPLRGLEEHLRRGDFSRWVADVFGDCPLARTVGALEKKYRASNRDVVPQVVEAIRPGHQFVGPALDLPAEGGRPYGCSSGGSRLGSASMALRVSIACR